VPVKESFTHFRQEEARRETGLKGDRGKSFSEVDQTYGIGSLSPVISRSHP